MSPVGLKNSPTAPMDQIAAHIYHAFMVSVSVDVGFVLRKMNIVKSRTTAAEIWPASKESVSVALLKIMYVKFPQTAVVNLPASIIGVRNALNGPNTVDIIQTAVVKNRCVSRVRVILVPL